MFSRLIRQSSGGIWSWRIFDEAAARVAISRDLERARIEIDVSSDVVQDSEWLDCRQLCVEN